MSEAAYILDFTLSRAAHTATPNQPQAAGVSGDHRAATVRFLLTDPPADRLYRVEVCDGGGGYDVTELLTPQDNVVTCAIPSHWTAAGIATLRLTELTVQDGEETQVYHYPPVRLQFESCPAGEATEALSAWQAVMTAAQLASAAATEAAERATVTANSAYYDASVATQKAQQAAASAETAAASAESAWQTVGDIDAALDEILAIQEALIGGDA